MTAKKRRAPPGTHWRVLAQDSTGRRFEGSSKEHPITFDELVIDRFLHLEFMDKYRVWMALGPLHINVALKPNGDVDIRISRELADYGGVVHVEHRVDTQGKRLKAEPLRPQWNNKKPVSGWRVP